MAVRRPRSGSRLLYRSSGGRRRCCRALFPQLLDASARSFGGVNNYGVEMLPHNDGHRQIVLGGGRRAQVKEFSQNAVAAMRQLQLNYEKDKKVTSSPMFKKK